jgi:large subunit ribosomal protein L25
MAEKVELKVVPREVLGKKVRALRREGITPANIYGNRIDSQAVQVPSDELLRVLKVAGRNEIVFITLDGGEARPTFVHDIQRNPITDAILHVDFLQIDLSKKLKIDVPLHIEGSAPAVETYQGILVQSLDHVTVETLPTSVPSYIVADVSVLEEIDAALHVSDLPLPEGVEMVTDGEQLVAKVAPPVVEKIEEEEEEEELEEGAEEGEEAAEEGAEGEGGEAAEGEGGDEG